MKKILFFMAAAAFCISSCSKTGIPDTPAEDVSLDDITLDFTIPCFGGPETKAVKSDWAEGDKIDIWFGMAYDAYTEWDHLPDLVLTRVGSTWSPTFRSDFKASRLSSTYQQYMFYVYENYNNLDIYAKWAENLYYKYKSAVNFGTTLIVGGKSSLTYNSTKKKITASLDNWMFATRIQFVVKGLDPAGTEWKLGIDANSPSNHANLLPCYGFQLWGPEIDDFRPLIAYDPRKGEYAVGQANEDGVAFYFHSSTMEGQSATYDFELSKTKWGYSSFGTCSKTIKITVPENGMISLKMNKEDFGF